MGIQLLLRLTVSPRSPGLMPRDSSEVMITMVLSR